MGWQLIVSAMSAGANLFNAVDEAIANRVISESIRNIQNYLVELSQKISQIEANTRLILQKLDELPNRLRIIVREVVETALLNERWATLKRIHDDIIYLNNYRIYRINKPGWKDLSEALNYLFLYENRLSYVFKLIESCEMALGATRGRATPVILVWLKEKIDLIELLYNDLDIEIQKELMRLQEDLNNTNYIKEHNLDSNLEHISKLSYTKQPNRSYRAQIGTRRECREWVGPCRVHEVCHDEPVYGQVPDTGFHQARDRHASNIEAQIKVIDNKLSILSALVSLLNKLKKYYETIDNAKPIDVKDKVVLVYTTPKKTLTGYKELPKITDEMLELFNNYFKESGDETKIKVFHKDDNEQRMDTKYFYEVIKIPCGGD